MPWMSSLTSLAFLPQNAQTPDFFAIVLGLFLNKYFVNHAIFLGFSGGHPLVAVGVGPDLVVTLARVQGDDFVQFLLQFLDLASRDFNLGGLSLHTAHGLMDHDAGVG